MRLFCAYAFTGEDRETVTNLMRKVVDTLQTQGHEAYCDRFDDTVNALLDKDDVRGVFGETFRHVSESDAVVAIVVSPSRSIGQIMEIGVALNEGKPLHLFEHLSAADSSYLPRLADSYHSWETETSLLAALKEL